MRQFMHPGRLWGTTDGPSEDRVRPHVLWLPHDQPHVLAYLRQIAKVVAPYDDIVEPVAEADWHWTIQAIRSHDTAGRRVDQGQLDEAAGQIQRRLRELEPFEVVIGPVAASRSAVITRILPVDTDRDVDPATRLNKCVRAGVEAAGLSMPPAAEPHWGHHSAAYGRVDTDTPELAARSDDLASALAHQTRHHVGAVISSLWLVWEEQHPERSAYTFERVHQLHLAGAASPSTAGSSLLL
ncbi:hypothetical protein ACFU51_09095 [Streptomyces sp. NPDC057430]|uniref:hypothetical protein n=1 Tax=unclassified Streptomyces TaxID=2593676 RepID=UPI00367BDA11